MLLQPYELDTSTPDALMAFWKVANNHPVQTGRSLFPERPERYARATRQLAQYAVNKATAVGCRLRGESASALVYEGICERIFDTLPPFARW